MSTSPIPHLLPLPAMPRLSHTVPSRRLLTVKTLWARGSTQLLRARLHYGHGTDNAGDDAAALLAHAMLLRRSLAARDWKRQVTRAASKRYMDLLQRRITERIPTVYLTRRCWYAGVPLYIDERVLIPRSPIAELIAQQFAPWLGSLMPRRIADLGTGSGCIAFACALAFPGATVDAVDVSAKALQVASLNRKALGLSRRVRLVKSDFFAALVGRRYDIIVSNPPYVGSAEFRSLPAEYRHEPSAALRSGADGMQAVRKLLRAADRFLTPQGVLVVEVGNTEQLVRRAFPRLPLMWLAFANGGGGVFLLTAAQLRAARQK
jgi:ribosomal protein L3 glutamine methyltransferase